MSIPHQCQCPSCAPEAFPPLGGRMGVNHFAVRFDDERRGGVVLCPYLDGVKVTKCIEAMAGEDGWALVLSTAFAGQVHRCRSCGGDACMEVRHGYVQMVGQRKEVA